METDLELMAEIETRLNSVPMFSKSGAKAANFDLSSMRRFCDLLGNPQSNLKTIHVAGTNGKGTTCRMLASIYQEQGYRVGLYTSPHLTDVRERFLVNGRMIAPEDLKLFIDKYWDKITEHSFTYFEITTAIAFWHFSRSDVDIAVIETGLGGRLDATNVIVPLASVITSVGLDHTDILGSSISEIATEKAGIIKPNIPVVTGNLTEEAFQVVKKIANEKFSNLYNAQQSIVSFQDNTLKLQPNGGNKISVKIESAKSTDAGNASIAISAVYLLQDSFPVQPDAIKKGIEHLNRNYPGKGVFYRLSEDKKWYFDGAHNRDSVKALTEHLQRIAKQEKWTVVLSFMADKLNTDIADYWNQFSNIWICLQNSERAASLEQMKSYFPNARVLNLSDQKRLPEFKTELVIFSGSFYFYSILSDWMGSGTASDK